jgi:hypothetical protein
MSDFERGLGIFGDREGLESDQDDERPFWVCTICRIKNYGKVCKCGVRKDRRSHQQKIANQKDLWLQVQERGKRKNGKNKPDQTRF